MNALIVRALQNSARPYLFSMLLATFALLLAAPVNVVAGFRAAPQPTTTILSSSLNPSTVGQNVRFTAWVNVAGGSVSGGTVTFSEGGTVICNAVTLNAISKAFCDTSSLSVGTHNIIAEYSDGADYDTSSGNVTQVVKADTITTLAGPSGNFTAPQSFTFTATVTEAQNAPSRSTKTGVRAPNQVPTGTVTFYDNGVAIPTCTSVPLVGGVATCTVTLGAGTHVISAVYSGDANFNGSTSTTTLTLAIGQTVVLKFPAEVPEADTLLLMSGGIGGLGVWLRWQWSKRKRVSG